LAQVTITARGKTQRYTVRDGLGFQALAAQSAATNPVPIEFDCREADCGICMLRVRAGMENLSPPTKVEAECLKAMRAEPDERLACQCRILGDCEVLVEDP
jgi:ferredoxin